MMRRKSDEIVNTMKEDYNHVPRGKGWVYVQRVHLALHLVTWVRPFATQDINIIVVGYTL